MVEDVINQYQLEKRENKPARVYKGRIRTGKVKRKLKARMKNLMRQRKKLRPVYGVSILLRILVNIFRLTCSRKFSILVVRVRIRIFMSPRVIL